MSVFDPKRIFTSGNVSACFAGHGTDKLELNADLGPKPTMKRGRSKRAHMLTVSPGRILRTFSKEEASVGHWQTIRLDATQWAHDNPDSTDALHFCLTVL
jgi:hypothetical protein